MTPLPEIRVERTAHARLAGVDLGNAPFSSVFSDHMLIARYRAGRWEEATIRPYGPLPLPVNVSSLQYGLSAFEGTKAHRTAAGQVALFRPDANARRLNRSAARLAMAEVPEALFLGGLRRLVALDAGWVPPLGAGALYIRPCLFSTDPSLRVKPAEEFLFVVVSCPFGSYYSAPVAAEVAEAHVRAFPGGTGDIKSAGNYAAALLADREAQARGAGTVLWLDGIERRYVEECGVMNVFFVLDDRVLTPALSGTILPGVTRDSALRVLRDQGRTIEERRIAIDEVVAWHADGRLRECFGTGTAATLSPIARIRHGDTVIEPRGDGRVGADLRAALLAIMTGASPDPYGWLDLIDPAD